MGGRSREPQEPIDKFGFVSEISNERLINYGLYTSSGFQNDTFTQGGSLTKNAIPKNPEAFNSALSAEYQKRFGTSPDWKIDDEKTSNRWNTILKNADNYKGDK